MNRTLERLALSWNTGAKRVHKRPRSLYTSRSWGDKSLPRCLISSRVIYPKVRKNARCFSELPVSCKNFQIATMPAQRISDTKLDSDINLLSMLSHCTPESIACGFQEHARRTSIEVPIC